MFRKVKGIVALLLITTLAIAVAGCSGSKSNSSSTSTPAPVKKLHVTMIAGIANDPFYVSMARGAREEANKNGIEFDMQAALTWDVGQQTQILNAVIAKKPDLIMIAPTDRKGMFAPIKQAKDAGIPVILVDTTLDDTSHVITNIASDNIEGGRMAAKALLDLVGNKGKVFVLNTKPGISTTDERVKGFEEGIKNATNVKYLGVQFNDDDPNKATAQTSAVLQANPDLAGIFASNLVGGNGANVALKNAGKDKQVKIIEFDGGPDQVKALREGTIQALIVQKPFEIGAKAIQVAVDYLKNGKKDFEKVTHTGYVIATQENMNQAEISKYFYTSD